MSRLSKNRVYEILEATKAEDPIAEAVNFLLMALVVLNVIAVILETVPTKLPSSTSATSRSWYSP